MNKKKWAIYCAGNVGYLLSENREPIKMLKSFQLHFKDEVDYIYFTDKDEENLDEAKSLCDKNGIKLILGNCKEFYNHYKDIEFIQRGFVERWPDAMYWYVEAPEHLVNDYDFLIKCDGDMFCNKNFNLNILETQNAVSIAEAPSWYSPADIYSPNAGFQILNTKQYRDLNIKDFFRKFSKRVDIFNSDTPLLDFLVGQGLVTVTRLPSDYNYLLFDLPQVKELKYHEIYEDIKIVHFVGSKPHQFIKKNDGMYIDEIGMEFTVKDIFSKRYLQF